MKAMLVGLATTALLSACSNAQEKARDQAEDEMEVAAERSANIAGNSIAALGLTERQLLEADLVDIKGLELGDITSVVRGTGGQVEQIIVEVEDSNPDRFVRLPIDGLTPQQNGNDWNVVTSLTKQQLEALPEVPLPTPRATTPLTP